MKIAVVYLGEGDKAALYSVCVIGQQGYEDTEYDKYLAKMQLSDPRDKRQSEQVKALVNEIREYDGVIDKFFRNEQQGLYAIPHHKMKRLFWDSDGTTHYGPRLYCIRLNEELLILLNGCSKSERDPKNCESCKEPFLFARQLTPVILDAIVYGKLIVEGRDLIMADDEEADIIFDIK